VRVFVAASAEADVESIKDYYGPRNPAATDLLLARMGAAVTLLAIHPLIGHSGRVPGTRELEVTRTPFVLVYVVADHALTVVRVLHQHQQWPPG
jgi:toxin ParE1/3/4